MIGLKKHIFVRLYFHWHACYWILGLKKQNRGNNGKKIDGDGTSNEKSSKKYTSGNFLFFIEVYYKVKPNTDALAMYLLA